MTANIKPDAWTLSPQMTAAPNLWRGILHVVPLWERIGQPSYIAPSKRLPSISFQVGEWTSAINGAASQPDGTSPSISNAHIDASDDNRFSILESGRETTILANFVINQNVKNWIGGVDQEWGFAMYDGTSSPYIRFDQFGNNSGSAGEIGFGLHTAAIRVKAGSGGKIFLDGHLYNTYSNSETSSDGNAPLAIGGRLGPNAAAERVFPGEVGLWAMWERRLHEDELRLLTADPFAMIRPAGF